MLGSISVDLKEDAAASDEGAKLAARSNDFIDFISGGSEFYQAFLIVQSVQIRLWLDQPRR